MTYEKQIRIIKYIAMQGLYSLYKGEKSFGKSATMLVNVVEHEYPHLKIVWDTAMKIVGKYTTLACTMREKKVKEDIALKIFETIINEEISYSSPCPTKHFLYATQLTRKEYSI